MLILFHPPPPPSPTSGNKLLLFLFHIPSSAQVISFEYDFNELSHYRLGQVSQGLRTMRCENVVLEGSGIVCVSQILAGSDQWMYGPDLTVRQTPAQLIIKSTHPTLPSHPVPARSCGVFTNTVLSQYYREVFVFTSHLTPCTPSLSQCLKHPLRPCRIR